MNVKKKFPWGILVLMLVLLLPAAFLVPTGYFYYTARTGTAEIAAETRAAFAVRAETLASLAEISYLSRDIKRIKKALMEKPAAGDTLELFFVLANGVIVAHSDSEKAASLQGNIAGDEFAYNLDQIFLPLRKKSREVFFLDYNIIDQKIPYPRYIWMPMKEYLYDGIDRVGWLATRAVYSRGKPIGTVGIIISKRRIYRLIETAARNSLIMLAGMAVFSLFLSFVIPLIVFRRYGRVAADAAAPVAMDLPLKDTPDEDILDAPELLETIETERPYPETVPYQSIKDAIPVAK